MNQIKVVYMGTPKFSVPPLKMLIENCHVVGVVTQPDKEIGRHHEISMSIIKKIALDNNIKVLQPNKIRTDFQSIIDLQPDLIITCAYGQIIPKELLECAKYGAINIHASILPKYRGSAPINWAIINGESETGITLMYMDEHMDTGDIIDIVKTNINDNDTYGSLYDRLSLMGSDLLEKNLMNIIDGKVKRIKQDESLATLAPMIKRDIEHVDFMNNGIDIINKIRGLNPSPYANIIIDNKEIKIIEAYFVSQFVENPGNISVINKTELGINCLNGIIYLTKVKPFGKNEMDIKNYLNGLNKDKILNARVL